MFSLFTNTLVDESLSDTSCKLKSDVGFVMDVSGSVGYHFYDEKMFVKKIAASINISPEWGRAGVVLFSSNNPGVHSAAQLMIRFSDYDTYSDQLGDLSVVDSFVEAINDLPFWAGGTRIDKGLEVAYTQLFKESNGMRHDSTKYLILITDGKQDGVNYNEWSNKFARENIKVIVIGVGDVNTRDLLKLVVVDSDLHLAENFDNLMDSMFTENMHLCQGKLSYKY